MNIAIPKNQLKSTLSTIQNLCRRKADGFHDPSTVRLETGYGGISIKATDLNTYYIHDLAADVQKPGAIVIDCRKLYQIVSEFPGDVNLIEEEPRWIALKNGSTEYHIVGLKADEFPSEPDVSDGIELVLPAMSLKRMIERVSHVVGASDDSRAHITSAYFSASADGIELVHTDGARLAISKHSFPEDYSRDERVIDGLSAMIPKASLLDLSRAITSGISEVSLLIGENHVRAAFGDHGAFVIRLAEGDFPGYKDIVYRESPAPAVADKGRLVAMFRRMSILTSEAYKGSIFELAPGDPGTLTVTTTNPDIGESREEMNVDYNGPEIEAAFNIRFFLDAIASIGSETISLDFQSGNATCLVSGQNESDFVGAIMPMKV